MVGFGGDKLFQFGNGFPGARLRDDNRRAVRAACDFQLPLAEKIRRVHLHIRTVTPDITKIVSVVVSTNFKVHADIAFIARRHRLNPGDLPYWKTPIM